jgi:ATP-dependent exoDNAse (exonuclease V) alpha subunit
MRRGFSAWHRLAHSIFTWKKALNPQREIGIECFGWTFCPDDKVMQVENDYDKEVPNGDLDVVSRQAPRRHSRAAEGAGDRSEGKPSETAIFAAGVANRL